MKRVGVEKSGLCFQEKWPEFLKKHGAEVKMLDLLAPDWLEQVRECDAVMWHWRHHPDAKQSARTLLHVIESELGLPVFPNTNTAWHFDNKIAQSFMLAAHDLPRPESWVFWSYSDATSWAASAKYPVVFKLATGAGSTNVKLVENEGSALRLISRMFSASGSTSMMSAPAYTGRLGKAARELFYFVQRCASIPGLLFLKRPPPLHKVYWEPQKNYAFFQEFIPGNKGDTRITVIGDRAFGFRRSNRPGDFRASGSGRIDHDPGKIDSRCIEQAFAAARALKASQSIAFDFLHRKPTNEPVIIEFSYGYLSSVVADCPGHWNRQLEWQEGSMWPEEAHVIDLLADIERRSQQTP